MGLIVIAVYKPKNGKEEQLKEILKSHTPLLRSLGLATFRQPVIMKAKNGSYLELFEWSSRESVDKAHSHPDVQALWKKFRDVCEYETLSSLEESSVQFPEFEPVSL
ncbi:MAG: hypothetical protein N2510_08890 [Ignavibacteria bacterium]|nr:hypothetical protein [Ignavibacteria bacterium]